MVKKRHRAAIPFVRFEQGSGLGLEVVGLQQLIAREVHHDLTQPQRPMFHHLLWVTAGPGVHTVDFRRLRLKPGCVLYVGPGQVQQFSLDASLDASMIVFESDFVRLAMGTGSAPLTLNAARSRTVAALFETVAREHAAWDGTVAGRKVLQSLLEALLLASGAASTERSGSLHQRFCDALEESFARAHEVAAYAAILDCSPRTLARVCERATGQSAKEVIDARVVLEAKRLLAHGALPAALISAQLGFAEPTQFGKFFKRLASQSPAKFRERFHRT